MANKVGGIYGEVGLDISQATKNIKKLKNDVKGLEKVNKALSAPSIKGYDAAFGKLEAMTKRTTEGIKKNNAALKEANAIIAKGSEGNSAKEIRAAKERVRYNTAEIEKKKQLLNVIQDVNKGLEAGKGSLAYEDVTKQLEGMLVSRTKLLDAQEKELANAQRIEKASKAKAQADAQATKEAIAKARAVEEAAKAQQKVAKEENAKQITPEKQDIVNKAEVQDAKAVANSTNEIKKNIEQIGGIDLKVEQSDIDHLTRMLGSLLDIEDEVEDLTTDIDKLNNKKISVDVSSDTATKLKSISEDFNRLIADFDKFDISDPASGLEDLSNRFNMLKNSLQDIKDDDITIVDDNQYKAVKQLQDETSNLIDTFQSMAAEEAKYAAKTEAYNKNKKLEVTFNKARAAARNLSEELKDIEGPDSDRLGKLNYEADDLKAMTKDGDILREQMAKLQKSFGGANYALKHLKATGQGFSEDATKMSTYIELLRMKLEALKKIETGDPMRIFSDEDLMKPIGQLETLDEKGQRLYDTLKKTGNAADAMTQDLKDIGDISHVFDTLVEGLGKLEQNNPIYKITKDMELLEQQTLKNNNAVEQFKDAQATLNKYNELRKQKESEDLQTPDKFNRQFSESSAEVDKLIDRYVKLRQAILEAQAVELGKQKGIDVNVEELDLENSLRASIANANELEDALKRVGLLANVDTSIGEDIDKATKEAKELGTEIDGIAKDTNKLNSKFRTFFRTMERGFSGAAANANKTTNATRSTASNVSKAANETARMDKEAKSSLFSFKNISRVVSGIMISQGFYRALNAATSMLTTVGKTQALVENMNVSFGVMLRDFGAAEDFMQDIREFAAVTPFSFEEASKNAKMLKAYGFEAQQIIPIMEKLGDASAAIAEPETFARITRALGQINTKGRLMQEEVRQLTEAGINMGQILTEELKLTSKEMQNIGKLGIPAQAAIGATLRGIQKQFGGSAQYLSRTLTGMFSTIRDNMLFISTELFQGVFDASKVFMRSILGALEETTKKIIDVGIGGWLESVLSESSMGILRNFIAGFINWGYAIKEFYLALQPLIMEFVRFALLVGNVVGPALTLFTRLLSWVISLITDCAPLVRFLAYSIGSLMVAMTVSKAIAMLVGAIKALAYSTFVAKAVTMLKNAIMGLAFFLNKHPIGWLLMALGLALGGLALKSDNLSKAFNRLGNSFNKLGGVDPDKLLTPKEAKKETDATKKSYDETGKSINKAGKETDDLGKKAKKAKKEAKDAAAAFDELFQLSKLDENDKKPDVDAGFNADDWKDSLDDVLAGLGDINVPIGVDPTLPEDFDWGSELGFGEVAGEIAGAIGDIVMAVTEATGIKWLVEMISDSIWKMIQLLERSFKLVVDVMKITGQALSDTGNVIFTTTTLVVSELGLMFQKYGEIISKGIDDIVASWTENITPWFDRSLEQFNGWITDTVLSLGRWGADSLLQFVNWSLDSLGIFANWSIDSVAGFFDWAGDTGGLLWDWLGETWGIFTDWDNWTWENFSSWWGDTVDGFWSWCSDTGDRLWTWFDDTTGGFLTWAGDTWNGRSTWWDDTWDGWSTWWDDTWNGLSTWWSDTKKSWGQWGSDVANSMGEMWSALKQATSESMGRIGTYMSEGWASIKEIWSNWGNQLSQLWDWFWEDVGRIAGDWWEDIKGMLWDWVKSMINPFKWLGEKVNDIFSALRKDTKDATEDANKAAKELSKANAQSAPKESSSTRLERVLTSVGTLTADTSGLISVARASQTVPTTRQVMSTATNYYNSSTSSNTKTSTNTTTQGIDVNELATAIANAIGPNDDKPIFNVGNLIATERGLKELAEKLDIIRRNS